MNDKEKNRKKKLHDRYKEGYDKNELVGERTDGRKGDGREENYRKRRRRRNSSRKEEKYKDREYEVGVEAGRCREGGKGWAEAGRGEEAGGRKVAGGRKNKQKIKRR